MWARFLEKATQDETQVLVGRIAGGGGSFGVLLGGGVSRAPGYRLGTSSEKGPASGVTGGKDTTAAPRLRAVFGLILPKTSDRSPTCMAGHTVTVGHGIVKPQTTCRVQQISIELPDPPRTPVRQHQQAHHIAGHAGIGPQPGLRSVTRSRSKASRKVPGPSLDETNPALLEPDKSTSPHATPITKQQTRENTSTGRIKT